MGTGAAEIGCGRPGLRDSAAVSVAGQWLPCPVNPSDRDAHDFTQLSSAITTSAVGVGSSVRRKRYHHDEIMRLAEFAGTSPRSSHTKPKPPPCSNKSVALNAYSKL